MVAGLGKITQALNNVYLPMFQQGVPLGWGRGGMKVVRREGEMGAWGREGWKVKKRTALKTQ